ncbi:LamG-like jellyroll fold domain-containing protein [Streptosporangium sp. NPDC051023]|uniref:LamG-like jellyroll fold domain-containing protein n=1 Tax=Streptosporangium sp. NPDC051023 TaxID=3155410 RepID=UPI00344FBF21
MLISATPGVAAADAVRISAPRPVTPKQLTGSAKGFPSLVKTEVTTTTVDGTGWKNDAKPPKDAVPVDKRLIGREVREGLTERLIKGGAKAAPPGGQPMAALLAGEPALLDAFPRDDMLVDSLTPTLRAQGKVTTGSGPLQYAFKICDNSSLTGTGCTSSGTLSSGVSTWKVPASKLAWGKQYWWQATITDTSNSASTTVTRTFVTGVRQPVLTSQLATSEVAGREFNQLAGNYTTTFTDLTVPSAGPPLSVVRTYNSMDPRTDGLFGAGWSTRWDMKLAQETRGSAVSALITYPDGRQVRFAKTGSTYQSPPGMFATLADVSGGGWQLMDKGATSYVFDAQGRLTSITDARGRSQTLAYGTGGKLSTATAPGGRSLTFTWTGDHVTSVASDPVGGTPITWTYFYDGDKLTGACAPVAAPNCTTYAYGSGSQYRSNVLDSDPYGYWRLGEASGTTATDLGAAAADATYQGVTYGKPGALAGSTDTAVEFTTGSSLKLPANIVGQLGDQLSVETWFKTSQSGVLVAAGTQETSGIPWGPMLYVGTDGKLRGSLAAVAAPITTTGTVNDDAWHHVVLTAAGTAQTLYLDGVQVGTTTGSLTTWRTSATVGNGVADPAVSPAVPTPRAAFPFKGVIDEVALYDKPLTAAEVTRHYGSRLQTPNKLTTVTLPSGRVWASNTYDAATDRLKTHTDHNGGTWQLGVKTFDPYSSAAQVIVTDPKNETLKYLYDSERGYRLLGETDQLNYTTWYEYNLSGSLSKIIDRNDIANDVYYDERGNLLARKYCRAPGECALEFKKYYLNTSNPLDPRNDQVIEYRDGRSASETDNTYRTTTEYTTYGEVSKVTTPATADFPSGRSMTTTYTDGTEPAVGGGTTPAGLVKSQKNPKNEETTYRYNAAGDVAEQTMPSGLVITTARDAVGRVTSRTEVSAAHPTGATTTFTYDGVGRPLTQTEPGVDNEVTGVTHTAKSTIVYNADGDKATESLTDLTGGDPVRTTTYTYDTHGRVETVTAPEGGVTGATWDVTGLQTSVTNPLGTVTTFGYTKRGELASKTLKNWTGSPVSPQAPQDVVLESFSYDFGGRTAGQIDAMGRKKIFTYWMDNQLSQSIADDAKLNGLTTPADVVLQSNEFDPAGNLVEQISGAGKTTVDHVYDAAGRKTSTTVDPASLNRKTAYVYDAVNNVTRETFTGAGTTRTEITDYQYNTLGQVTRQTVENGAVDLVTTSTYDDRGLLTATTDPRGNASGATAADFTTTMRYDIAGQLVETKAPQVAIEKNGTAAVNARPTVKYGYNNAGESAQSVDAEGRTVTLAYDKAGRVTSTTAPSYTPPGGTAVTPTIAFTYDAAGRRTQVTDPRGYVTKTDYDALGRPVRQTDPGPSGPGGVWVSEFDLLGEQLAAVDPTGVRGETTYDDLGRKITQTQIERVPTSAAYTTALTYDAAGNLTKSVAPGNKTTTFTVNAAGEVTATSDPLTHSTTVGYDIKGRQTKITDALNNATEAVYDLAGRKTSVKNLDSTGATVRTVGYGYDLAGNATTTTSGEGYVTTRAFDAANRVTSLVEPITASKTITTTFGYDATNARTRLTDGRGNVTWTTYNPLSQAESVIEPSTTAHPNAADRTWTTVYDASGNAVATVQPGGVRIDRTFDQLNRVTKETGAGASVTTPDRDVTYDQAGRTTAIGDYTLEYNDRGLLTKVSKATVQVATYAYDSLGNPTQRVDPTGTANFTWDNASRLATAGDPVTGRTWTYGYDNADRLTSQTSAGTVNSQAYTYDAIDRLATHTLKNSGGTQLAKITYGWDKDDNLTSKATVGTAGAGANTYAYDRSGRLTSWTSPSATTAYTWDDAGNRTGAGSKTYTYDERNRLTSGDGVDYTYTPRGTTATETKAGVTRNLAFDAFDRLVTDGDVGYGYDALGRVTSRTKAGTQQRYVYSGLTNDIATVTDAAGAVQAKYARDPSGGLLGLQEGGTTALGTMTDLHGDLVATFSGTALADSAAFDPFGQVTHRTGATRALGYQGEYADQDTGKVNMHARWYQPGTGAFTSRDTATLDPDPSVQANRYTYANAAPLAGTDPTGHSTVIETGGAGGSRGGGSGWQGAASTPAVSSGSTSWDWVAPPIGRNEVYYAYGENCCVTFNGTSKEDVDWYNDRFGDWTIFPLFDRDEAIRIGVMENGREIDQANYWDAPEDVRIDYIKHWTPQLKVGQLANNWVMAGGMQYLEPKKVVTAPGKPTFYMSSAGKIKFSNYGYYQPLIKYSKEISTAAHRWKVNKNALMAVLIYEYQDPEAKASLSAAEKGKFARNLAAGGVWAATGENGSYGIAQLEPKKAMLVLKYFFSGGKAEAAAKLTLKDLAYELMIPEKSIEYAAMYLKYLHNEITVHPKGGAERPITWREAAIAYCGCAGVTFDKKGVLRWYNFQKWYTDDKLTTRDRGEAFARAKAMYGWAWSAGTEYWSCVERGCK